MQDGQERVASVRDATARHRIVWRQLVPSPYEVNPDAEEAEERAYQAMAEAKRALREHICETYGVTAQELCSLSTV